MLLLGTSSLTGPTDIVEGTLQVDGSQPDSAVSVGGTLSGTGSVGAITNDGGTISPRRWSARNLDANRRRIRTVVASGSSSVAIERPGRGLGYDQLAATGTVNLSEGTFDAALGLARAAAGDSFTVITSTSPIVGTFIGLPQGASLQIGSVPFAINYAGGTSGDDVVLTPSIASIVPTQLVVTAEPPGSATAGGPFGLAVSVEDGSGDIDSSYTGSVVLALASGTGTLGGTTSLNVVDGVATSPTLT